MGAALRKGELNFTLAGEKLQGSFVLVRMKHDRERGKRNNWLLIKHRDEFASEDDVAEQDKSVAFGRSTEQIAAGKSSGPKPFMAAGSKASAPSAIWHCNQAKEGMESKTPPAQAKLQAGTSARKTATAPSETMLRFVPPQLCKTLSRPPHGDDWVHEIKFDAYRMQLRVEGGAVTMLSRKGLDWTNKFRAVAKRAAGFPDVIIDGEVVALDDSDAPNFAALQATLSDGRSQDLIYFVFDLLFVRGEDRRARPLSERKERLKTSLAKSKTTGNIRYVGHLSAAGDAVLQSACRMHLEGIISKRVTAPYTSGRIETWTKSKCRTGHEVVIGGWSDNTTKLLSLIAGVYRGDHLVHVGQLGTGFNARNSKALLWQLKANVTDISPFAGKDAPRQQRDWNWVKPVLVAEIEFAAGRARA